MQNCLLLPVIKLVMLFISRNEIKQGLFIMVFYAKGISEHNQQDVWEQGCLPETSCSYQYNERFFGNSLEELFNNLASHFKIDKQNISINDCEKSIINVSVYEKARGIATKNDIEKWKKGDIKLWLCDYTFVIEKREGIDFSTMPRDDLKKMGVSV